MMKYQKYDKYKISNNPWFSELPENWDVSRIKFNSILFGRIGYRGYSTDDLVEEKEGAITLSPSNMINGKLDFSKCTYLSWDKYNESPEIKMRDHDVVMVKTGSTIGKVSIAEKIEYPTTINPQLVLYKKIKCNPKYLFYYLFSKNAQDRIPLYNSGSTIPTMKQEDIGRFYLPMPSMNEQNSIVEFLDRETTHIDTLIDKKQKLIDLLKEKRTALITKAVTKGLNPDVKMKDSGIEWLGEVPEHWDVKKLKFISSINDETLAETTQEDYEIKYVDIGSIDPNYGITNKQEMIFAESPSRARRKVKDGDVIVSTVRTYLRAIAPIIKPEQNLIVSTGFAVIRPRKVTSRFLEYALRGVYFVEKIVSLSVGVSYPAINSSTLSNIFIALPPTNEEQLIISNYLKENIEEIDRITNKVSEAINKHREYRTAIISAAVTGKIKVTHD